MTPGEVRDPAGRHGSSASSLSFALERVEIEREPDGFEVTVVLEKPIRLEAVLGFELEHLVVEADRKKARFRRSRKTRLRGLSLPGKVLVLLVRFVVGWLFLSDPADFVARRVSGVRVEGTVYTTDLSASELGRRLDRELFAG